MAKSLVSTADLITRTGQRDVTEISDLMENLALAASTYLEAELQTKFDAVAGAKDYFYIDNDNPLPHTVLGLSAGLVSDVIGIKTASTIAALTDSTAVIEPTDTKVDLVKGLITLNSPLTNGTYVEVEYDYGLEDADTDGYYEAVPSWLSELAIQYVIFRVSMTPPFNKSMGSKTKSNAYQPILLETLLQSHVRCFPQALIPL